MAVINVKVMSNYKKRYLNLKEHIKMLEEKRKKTILKNEKFKTNREALLGSDSLEIIDLKIKKANIEISILHAKRRKHLLLSNITFDDFNKLSKVDRKKISLWE